MIVSHIVMVLVKFPLEYVQVPSWSDMISQYIICQWYSTNRSMLPLSLSAPEGSSSYHPFSWSHSCVGSHSPYSCKSGMMSFQLERVVFARKHMLCLWFLNFSLFLRKSWHVDFWCEIIVKIFRVYNERFSNPISNITPRSRHRTWIIQG